jgi:hypothetical protein
MASPLSPLRSAWPSLENWLAGGVSCGPFRRAQFGAHSSGVALQPPGIGVNEDSPIRVFRFPRWTELGSDKEVLNMDLQGNGAESQSCVFDF